MNKHQVRKELRCIYCGSERKQELDMEIHTQ